MNKLVALAAMLASTFTAACVIDVDVDEEVEGRINLQVDMTGECAGEGEIVTELGTTKYTKVLEDDGAICRIDLAWDGILVDIPSLREDIEAQVKIDDVTITAVDIDVITAALEDANGKTVTPPAVPYWSATLDAAGERLLDLQRIDVSRLDAEKIVLTISDKLVDEADRALHEDKAIRATATSTLLIDADDLPALQAAPGPVGIELEIVTTVGATAKVHPLRR